MILKLFDFETCTIIGSLLDIIKNTPFAHAFISADSFDKEHKITTQYIDRETNMTWYELENGYQVPNCFVQYIK